MNLKKNKPYSNIYQQFQNIQYLNNQSFSIQMNKAKQAITQSKIRKTYHISELEKLTTDASTFEQTSKNRYTINQSLLKASDQLINIFLPNSAQQTKSLIQIRQNTTSSELKESEKTERYNMQGGYLSELLLSRPQKQKKKIINSRKILKTEQSPPHHQQKDSIASQQQKVSLLKRSQIRMYGHNQMKSSSKQKIEVKETLPIQKITFDSKSIQCELSLRESIALQDQQQPTLTQLNLQFNYSPKVGQSYYSLNTSQDNIAKQSLNIDYLNTQINQLYINQQEQALRLIIKNFRNFVEKQKELKQKNLSKNINKQNFQNFIVELGAIPTSKNMMIDDKLAKIKQMIHICQTIDQGLIKSWIVYSSIKQVGVVCWKIKNISWTIFKRITTKKTQMHPDIAKLYKEFPKYSQIIEIWNSQIDGTNAIFVLLIQLQINNRNYLIRLHFKNIQNIAKDYENVFSSIELISNFTNIYFHTHGIEYNSSTFSTTQYILAKQTILRQDVLKRGCQNISNHIHQLFIHSFMHIRTLNGYKFRRITFADEILENQTILENQIKERRKLRKYVFQHSQIGSSYFEIKNNSLRNKKLLKSQSIVFDIKSPSIKQQSQVSPTNYWPSIRSQSFRIELQDEIVEEVSFTPVSGKSSTPREANSRIKSQTFSSAFNRLSNRIKKKTILEDYFKNYPKFRPLIEITSIPMNPYQSYHILLVYISKNEDEWFSNSLSFIFDFENVEQFGYFTIQSIKFNEKEIIQTFLPLNLFAQRVQLQLNSIKISLGYYRNLSYLAKINFLNSMDRPTYKKKEIIEYDEIPQVPEFRVTKRIQRKSLFLEPNQVSKDHLYIFFFKPYNQPRVLFRIKTSFQKNQEITHLFIYSVQKPIYIKIIDDQFLIKIQEIFKKILQRVSRPLIGEFQQLQRVLMFYLKKQQKAIGTCTILGFQNQVRQTFNYELRSGSLEDVYSTLLKHLVSNEQTSVKNLLRTYCKVYNYQLVSKLQNFKGTNLIVFTEYFISNQSIILEVQIFPFDKRLRSFKAYFNHNDLQILNLLNKDITEKAFYLKKLLHRNYNNFQEQVHIQIDKEFIFVNQLHENMQRGLQKPLFIKQKQAIRFIFQKVKKISNHFIIISIYYNLLTQDLIFQIYLPALCKQFRSIMSTHDFYQLNPKTLDQIISSFFLDKYEEYFNQIPNTYIQFYNFIKQFTGTQISDKISIKSRGSQESDISAISLEKYKNQNDRMSLIFNDMQNSPINNMTQSQRYYLQSSQKKASQTQQYESKHNSKTFFNKSYHPQRVSGDISIRKERMSVKPSISKFDLFYDIKKLHKLVSQNESELQIKFLSCYFWDALLENSLLLMTDYNKYLFQIDQYKGILRQLGLTRRVFIDEDYQLQIFFEQQQVEYGSMFEKYSFVSLKESQTTNIYFQYQSLSLNHKKTINLKCQFRQCIYNYSNNAQISYNTALRILKQSSDFITEEIRKKQEVISFPKVELKSITALRTNKKTLKLETVINNHSKYQFLYQSRLMMKIIVTILYKKEKFYFQLEECKNQLQYQLTMSIFLVEQNIPHIRQLLKCNKECLLGQRLLDTYRNQLIIIAYKHLYQINQ